MIEVRVDDLAFYDGEAIARPVDSRLSAITPVIRRLEAAAGEALAAQLQVQEPLAVGSAVVTGAGALGVELLIHAVVKSDEEPVSAGTVRRATASALQRADAWRIDRLALAPFGLGAGNLDPEASAAAMAEALAEHRARARFPGAVTVIVETPDEAAAFEAQLGRLGA